MTPELTPQEIAALEQEAVEYAANNYAKAPLQTVEDAEYIKAVSKFTYLAAALPRELLLKQERERVKEEIVKVFDLFQVFMPKEIDITNRKQVAMYEVYHRINRIIDPSKYPAK